MADHHRRGAALARVAVAALVAATVLAACGSDADSDGAASSTTAKAATTTTAPTSSTTPSQKEGTPTKTGLYGVRYCEVLLLHKDDATGAFSAEVWNTLGENDCPQAEWDELDASAIAKERKALAAVLNGPRYWTLDSITSNIRKDAPETTFGTLGMFQAAVIDIGTESPAQIPYKERAIVRENVFGFQKGRVVHELVTPDGTTYIMQAYSQIKDPNLQITDLDGLGDRLELPKGWTYRTRTLDAPLDVVSQDGVATVIQDELQNTYQKLPKA